MSTTRSRRRRRPARSRSENAGETPVKKRGLFGRIAGIAALVILLTVLLGMGLAAGLVASAVKSMPALATLDPVQKATSTIYDRDGNPVAQLHSLENRIPVKLERIPKHLRDAFIASEDELFYEHRGVSPKAILRALYVNLTGGNLQGGSTITQQLVKNAILRNPQRKLTRKIQEAMLSIELERRYTKDEILEMYLNQIALGHGAYGVEAASQLYFGKHVWELDLSESAMLAGLTPAPNRYSPYHDMEAAKKRRAHVLSRMVECGYISEAEAKKADEAPVKLAGLKKEDWGEASPFLDHVLQRLLDKYGPDKVYGGGLRIYTTLDPAIQEAAQKAISEVLDPVFPEKEGENAIRAAAVVMDVASGHVLAIAGRSHQGKLSFVDAVDAKRQPGSAFKPIVVYSAAMETGFSPGTVVDDAPVAFKVGSKVWRPKNYSGRFKGLVTIRYALEQSLNVPAVKVFDAIGPETGVEYAKKLGITGLITDKNKPKHDLFLPTALGGVTVGVTPLEMANAYGTLANRGIHVTPVSILKVTDQAGNTLEENAPARNRALSEEAAYLVTDMLRGVITRGTGTRAKIGRPAAGKTGTSDDYADAWFIGYTPKLVASVWMGYAERKPMDGIVGGKYPAMIWQKIMSAALKGTPMEDFKRPANIVTSKICTKSGKIPGPFCPAECIAEDIFIAGQQPTQTCDVHVPVEVCAENPTMLASPYCPSVVVKSFIKRPVPYTPGPDGKVPEDAVLEIPTKMCDKHTPLELPEIEPAPPVPGEPSEKPEESEATRQPSDQLTGPSSGTGRDRAAGGESRKTTDEAQIPAEAGETNTGEHSADTNT